MTKVTIEDKTYEMDALPKEAQSHVKQIAFCDTRIQELQSEMAMVRTARASYQNALMAALPKDS